MKRGKKFRGNALARRAETLQRQAWVEGTDLIQLTSSGWKRIGPDEKVDVSSGKEQFFTVAKGLSDKRIGHIAEIRKAKDTDPGMKFAYEELLRIVSDPKSTDDQVHEKVIAHRDRVKKLLDQQSEDEKARDSLLESVDEVLAMPGLRSDMMADLRRLKRILEDRTSSPRLITQEVHAFKVRWGDASLEVRKDYDLSGPRRVVLSQKHMMDRGMGTRLDFRAMDGAKLGGHGPDLINDALEDVIRWESQVTKPKLEKNDHTRLHRLVDCVQKEVSVQVTDSGDEAMPLSIGSLQTFVVKHDWAAAFGDTLGTIAGEELRMPFPMVAFEFMINGKPLIVIVIEQEDTTHKVKVFVEAKNGVWIDFQFENHQSQPVYAFAWAQVKAICVMLDSEVAETTTVPAPEKLNRKRAASGKTPLPPYRVVDLAHRHRSQSIARPATPTGRKMRAHWCRGYWMHFESDRFKDGVRGTKKWIKWMIKGDPDLGFVEKEYKL